jgi:hypothetical protein
VLGASDFALRIGLVLLFGLFLAVMYALMSLLYSRAIALFSLAVLSLGSGEVLSRELKAVAGYPEMLLFSTATFLTATYLAVTACPTPEPRSSRRWPAYGSWGLAAGLGIWSAPLTLPFAVLSFLLLLLTVRRELFGGAGICLVLGLVLGLVPIIAYNVTAPVGQGTLASLLRIVPSGGSGHVSVGAAPLTERIAGAAAVSIPVMTGGDRLCRLQPQAAWPLSTHSSPHTIACTAVHAAWGVGFIALWVWAILAAVTALTGLPLSRIEPETSDIQRQRARLLGRFLLLASAGATLGLFLLSPAPAHAPWYNVRYIEGLWVAMPAVLVPLVGTLTGRLSRPIRAAAGTLLAFLAAVLLLDTVSAFGDGGYTPWLYQQQRALASDLELHGVSHVYTDYWTCNWLAFETREKITCAVLDGHLRPSLDRYPAYRSGVRSDPHAWYVFRVGTTEATAFEARRVLLPGTYHRTVLRYYVVYQPT